MAGRCDGCDRWHRDAEWLIEGGSLPKKLCPDCHPEMKR